MGDIPNDDILWKIGYIREQGWVNMANVPGVKDIAEQLEWDDLVEWIEEEVEIGSGHNHNGEVWFKAATAAATGDRKRVDVPGGTTYIELESGGEIEI